MTRSSHHSVFEQLLGARERREPCVLVTVAAFKGSTPRKPGAKMLVLADGRTVGTIGGGAVEYEIARQAVSLLGSDAVKLVDVHLTHELGMCCGGGVTVMMEPQQYSPQLLLFGAGHVAEKLAAVAALADFEVIVIDARPELATSARFPAATRILVEEPTDVIGELIFDAEMTYAVIATHDHALDERIVAQILRRPSRFLGVIGSHRKREMFRGRLAAAGFEEQEIARMKTPMGLDINAETPAEIAVSVVAEMIGIRRARSTAA